MAFLKSFYTATSRETDIVNIHPDVDRSVREAGFQDGLVTVGVQGWEAGVGVCEYTEGVLGPLKAALRAQGSVKLEDSLTDPMALKAKGEERVKGSAGRNFSLAGLMASLQIGSTLTIPLSKGRLNLEPWLSVVLFDFDTTGKRREYYIHVLGEAEKKEKKPAYEER